MEHLIIVETDITDPSWVREYLVEVTPLVISYGGSYITRSSTIELLEGDRKSQYVLVAKFPSKDAALAFIAQRLMRHIKLRDKMGPPAISY